MISNKKDDFVYFVAFILTNVLFINLRKTISFISIFNHIS